MATKPEAEGAKKKTGRPAKGKGPSDATTSNYEDVAYVSEGYESANDQMVIDSQFGVQTIVVTPKEPAAAAVGKIFTDAQRAPISLNEGPWATGGKGRVKRKREEPTDMMERMLQAVEELKGEVKGLRADNAALRSENAALQKAVEALQGEVKESRKEIGEMRKELRALKSGATQAPSPQALYARVAATAPQGQKAQSRDQTMSHDHSAQQDRPSKERGVTLNLGKAVAELKKKPLAAIKEVAQKELQKIEGTKGVRVIGVSPIIGNRLEIQVGSKEQAEVARNNAQWTKGLGEGVGVQQAAWYPIKVDGVAREEICKKTGNGWQFKQGIEEVISTSNSAPGRPVKVMKAYWLSPPTTKKVGSMAVYLDSEEAAQRIIREGIFLIGANAAFPAPFLQKERPMRCYKCNQYGHNQWKCKATAPTCGKCAGAHDTKQCPGKGPDKCAACKGAHKVTDPRCKVWQEQKGKAGERQEKQRQWQGDFIPSPCR
jgi:hypothetical protein